MTYQRFLLLPLFGLFIALPAIVVGASPHDGMKAEMREAIAAYREQQDRLPAWKNKVRQPLLRAWKLQREYPEEWSQRLESPQHVYEMDLVRVEIRYDRNVRLGLHEELIVHGAVTMEDMPEGGWLETIIPLHQLPSIAGSPHVGTIDLARLPQYSGGTTSQAVELGNADLWHDGGVDGSGIVVAVIDAFNNTQGQIQDLQNANDWPPDEQLTLVPTCSDDFGIDPIAPPPPPMLPPPHGNGVLEVIYDLAPGADFVAYDPCGVSQVIQTVYTAVSDGVDIINLSLGIPRDTPGDGSAPPGSLAEAIEYARDQNVLVVISAGNRRGIHWGGEFHTPSGGNWHHWHDDSDAPEWANHRLVSGSRCIPDGEGLSASLYWNDWGSPTNDYSLWLWRFTDATTPFAISNNDQTGESWQEPVESISATADSAGVNHPSCGLGEAKYAWTIVNEDASGDQNFRFWSSGLEHRTFASTLGTPADSPAALTVGAIHAGSQNFAGFSSEGPILSPGGGAPTGGEYPKPDLVSFSGVDNTTYGTFAGTSVSAPHVTGMAALLWERHRWPFGFYSAENVAERLRDIGQTGSNDYPPSGHDFQTGWGRLRFQAEAEMVYLTQPSDTAPGSPIQPNVVVELLDDEGLRILSSPTQFVEVQIGVDPSNGQATLSTPFPYPALSGTAALSGIEIDEIGEGYTLVVMSEETGLTAESGPFDIIDRIFRDRFSE